MRAKFICPRCNRVADYHPDYDSYACGVCDIWLDEKCSVPQCEFCNNRPDKSSAQKDKK